MIAALLCIAGLLGPPKLPPMPGQDVPGAPAAKPSAPAKPSAVKPTQPSAPAVQPSAPSKLPTSPAKPPSESPPPAFAPEPVGTREDPFQLPDAKAEPPQPEPSAPPPSSDTPKAEPGRSAPAPRPTALPGDDDRPVLRIPPPKKPPFSGIGLFVGAGVSFTVALTEQIVAQRLVKTRCIDPVVEQSKKEDPVDEEAEQIGNAILKCVPGVLPAIAMRVHSDLALIAAIGMAAGGAALRAQRNAYDHAFASRTRKDIVKLRWAGVGLIVGGVVTYLVTGPTAWAMMTKCSTGKCVARARVMGFVTRDLSAAMIAGGAGMLAFSESYRRSHERFSRDRALAFSPTFGRGFAGLSLSGRF